MTSIDEARADQRARFLAARGGDPFAHADVVAAAAVLDAGFPWPEVMPLRVERNDERALVARRIADAGLANEGLRGRARAFLREERFYVEAAAFADASDAAFVLAEARDAVDSGAGDDVTTAAVRALPAFAEAAPGEPLVFAYASRGSRAVARTSGTGRTARTGRTSRTGRANRANRITASRTQNGHGQRVSAGQSLAVVEGVVGVLIAGLFSENTIVVPGAARALAALGATSAKDALRAALGRLRVDAEHGYEERQALGVVALALVALAGKSAANEVKAALAVVDGDDDTAHFAQLHAASWLATGDVAGARAFLERRSGLAWAAATLADLGATDATPDLARVRTALSAPATALAFDEALRRLRGSSPPAASSAPFVSSSSSASSAASSSSSPSSPSPSPSPSSSSSSSSANDGELADAFDAAFDSALSPRESDDVTEPLLDRAMPSSVSAPARPDLVWALGSMHPGEIALGVDSDNIFELAAAVTPPSVVEADAVLARDR